MSPLSSALSYRHYHNSHATPLVTLSCLSTIKPRPLLGTVSQQKGPAPRLRSILSVGGRAVGSCQCVSRPERTPGLTDSSSYPLLARAAMPSDFISLLSADLDLESPKSLYSRGERGPRGRLCWREHTSDWILFFRPKAFAPDFGCREGFWDDNNAPGKPYWHGCHIE